MPLNETNVDGRDERGLSSARALQVLGPIVGTDYRVPTVVRSEGNVALSLLTLEMISCDLGTKSSLGPDSYFTGGLIYSKTQH